MSRARRRFIVRGIAFLAGLAAFACAAVYVSLRIPYQRFEQPVTLEFPQGTTTSAMSAELTRAGVIRYPWQFMAARILNPRTRLLAGEYQFSHAASVLDVYRRIAKGDVYYYELVIPEGSNMFDVAALVDRLGFVSGSDFLDAARDPSMIRDLAPQAPTLEGYLFPSTYRVTRRATAQKICRMMTDLFRKEWRSLPHHDPAAQVNSVVTLASLVEKETGLAPERPLVASVYHNRLQMGMALDCDPTTIYAALLEGRYRGVIHRSDLERDSSYNTYKHSGLPPGPIASPGLEALKSALAPAETDYLYFVAKADGSGGHQFSSSLQDHNRAVQEYRKHAHHGVTPKGAKHAAKTG